MRDRPPRRRRRWRDVVWFVLCLPGLVVLSPFLIGVLWRLHRGKWC